MLRWDTDTFILHDLDNFLKYIIICLLYNIGLVGVTMVATLFFYYHDTAVVIPIVPKFVGPWRDVDCLVIRFSRH